jgi:hypothetical protein
VHIGLGALDVNTSANRSVAPSSSTPPWLVAIALLALLASLGSVGILALSNRNSAPPTQNTALADALAQKLERAEADIAALKKSLDQKSNASDLSGATTQLSTLSTSIGNLAQQKANDADVKELERIVKRFQTLADLLKPFEDRAAFFSSTDGTGLSIRDESRDGKPQVDIKAGSDKQPYPVIGGGFEGRYKFQLAVGERGGGATFRDNDNSPVAYLGANRSDDALGGVLELDSGDTHFYKVWLKKNQGQPEAYWGLSRPGTDFYMVFMRATQTGGLINVCNAMRQCNSLQGGADVAERFKVGDPELKSGDVASFKHENDSIVAVRSTSPSDTNVIGIVSGAGGLAPAMTIGPDDSDTVSIAMNGTVYARADASSAEIEQGSLLVTSGVPGKLMRAPADPRPGSVVGKALDSLSTGSGLIRVWVGR